MTSPRHSLAGLRFLLLSFSEMLRKLLTVTGLQARIEIYK